MKISCIDHVHLFQRNLEESVEFFSKLLGSRWLLIEKPWLKMVCAFSDNGMEIIQPTGRDPVGIMDLLEQKGPCIGAIGFKVPDIEAGIADLEARGVVLEGRGSYAKKPEVDIKACSFKPESAHGMPIELVEFGFMTPTNVARLNWIQKMPWMQPSLGENSLPDVLGNGINHLNLFQEDLETTAKFFTKIFGARWLKPVERPDQKFRYAVSDMGLNIIQPTGNDDLGITAYMKKHGEGVGSMGLRVRNLEKAIARFESLGVKQLGRPVYTDNKEADLKAVVFDPATCKGVMFELVEHQNTTPVGLANLDWVKNLEWME